MNRPQLKNASASDQRLSKRARKQDSKPLVSQSQWAIEQDDVKAAINPDQRFELFRQYGDFTMAYSTHVQPRLQYFVDGEDSPSGYIAYRCRWGLTFALGDPVACDTNRRRFLEQFVSQKLKPNFCAISESTARVLDSLGYYVNEMGVDTILDLSDYDFAGKEKEWLRYAANWTAKRNYTIHEAGFDELSADEIESISEAWRKTRTIKRKEVRFLNRPIVLRDEPGVRKFFLRSEDQRTLAFVFLDPLYRDGNIIGYVTSIKRRHPEAPLYAEQAIMKHVIEILKNEGVFEIRLGLSPGAFIEDKDFRANKLTALTFRTGYSSKFLNRYFYNVQGHATYKRRFRGREIKNYYASPVRIDIRRQLALIGICGLV